MAMAIRSRWASPLSSDTTRHSGPTETVTRAMRLLRSALLFAWPLLLALVVTLMIMVGLPMVLAAAA